MGKISINLSDEDKNKLKQAAQAQNKSLSEYCRERLLAEQTPEVNNKLQLNDDLTKQIMTISKNIMFLYKEFKNSEQNQLQAKKQTYYNSSYLYFLTQKLFPEEPTLANEIDKKIQDSLHPQKAEKQ